MEIDEAVEIMCTWAAPELFEGTPDEQHQAASPHSVEVAKANHRAHFKGALSALEAKGLCIAPMGPTCEMIEAGVAADYGGTPGARAANCYRAMLACARKGGG